MKYTVERAIYYILLTCKWNLHQLQTAALQLSHLGVHNSTLQLSGSLPYYFWSFLCFQLEMWYHKWLKISCKYQSTFYGCRVIDWNGCEIARGAIISPGEYGNEVNNNIPHGGYCFKCAFITRTSEEIKWNTAQHSQKCFRPGFPESNELGFLRHACQFI